MRLPFVAFLLFVLLFAFSIPQKSKNSEYAKLIEERKKLEKEYEIQMEELVALNKSIDSLKSRERIVSAAVKIGLGDFGIPTKITKNNGRINK